MQWEYDSIEVWTHWAVELEIDLEDFSSPTSLELL